MNILIVGSNGMLGQRLVEFYSTKNNINLFTASAEENSFFENIYYNCIDITNKTEVLNLFEKVKPDCVINAAAYTGVDKAEEENEKAFAINVSGVEYLAEACKEHDSRLIHISTDYVFNGENGPYSEDDETTPIGYYGKTKLEGEKKIIAQNINYAIIRTNVLYGPAKFGRNDFVKWVVKMLKDKNEIKIVTDQINNPTFIDDLVNGINLVITKNAKGIFNIGGEEFLSRYDFTLRIADFYNLRKDLIKKIITEELNQTAPRPLKSGLKIKKAEKNLGYKPLKIEESLDKMRSSLEL